MPAPENPNLAERLTGMETWRSGVDAQLADIRKELHGIGEAVGKIGKPNMSTVASFLGLGGLGIGAMVSLVLAFYAAEIRPIDAELIRQSESGKDLAKAVLVQNERIGQLGLVQQSNIERVANISEKVSDIERKGLPQVESIRTVVADIRKDLDAVIANGSPLTDKRLALVEYRIAQLEPKK